MTWDRGERIESGGACRRLLPRWGAYHHHHYLLLLFQLPSPPSLTFHLLKRSTFPLFRLPPLPPPAQSQKRSSHSFPELAASHPLSLSLSSLPSLSGGGGDLLLLLLFSPPHLTSHTFPVLSSSSPRRKGRKSAKGRIRSSVAVSAPRGREGHNWYGRGGGGDRGERMGSVALQR